MKKISIVSSCFNEQDNIFELYNQVKAQMIPYSGIYTYEQIFVDNCSTDKTGERLRQLAAQDPVHVKVIFNSRNFGHIRSPYWAIINAQGDAIVYLASDLQDPPFLITQFIEKWEQGFKIVCAIKKSSKEFFLMFFIRKLYYSFLNKISDDKTEMIKNFTGFGLYDKQIIDIIRQIDDPYPYFRGLISELGFDKAFIEFSQPKRLTGKTKNNFYTLYDNAMIGIIKHSRIPLRITTFLGFILSCISLFIAAFYFLYKLLNWNTFYLGIAPLVIGLFFFSSIQLFAIGILGEYIGAIYTRVNKKPIVVEKERINF